MNDSILLSIKSLLGLSDDYDAFDSEILMHINSAISVVSQLGVPIADGYTVTSPEDKWGDIIPPNTNLEMLKTLIFFKTKKAFDPPQNGTAMSALDSQISELEWRVNVEVDTGGNNNA